MVSGVGSQQLVRCGGHHYWRPQGGTRRADEPIRGEVASHTAELLEVFTTRTKQGEFEMEEIRAMAITIHDDTEWVVQVKGAGLDVSEMTSELVANI